MKLSSRKSAHACAQHAHVVLVAGDIGEPGLVLLGRLRADTLDVAHHGEAQGVGIEPREAAIGKRRLIHNGRMHVHELEHRAFGEQAALEHAVDDLVMHERRAALVHDLGLALRIEVLRQHAHDAQQLALPAVQFGRILLQEIEQVLFGELQRLLLGLVLLGFLGLLLLGLRQRTPQLIVDLDGVLAAADLTLALARGIMAPPRLCIAADALVHQRVRGIHHGLDLRQAVALLALGHEFLCEGQIL